MFSMFITCMSNFISIQCYLLSDPKIQVLGIIFKFNLKFKIFIDQIIIDLWW